MGQADADRTSRREKWDRQVGQDNQEESGPGRWVRTSRRERWGWQVDQDIQEGKVGQAGGQDIQEGKSGASATGPPGREKWDRQEGQDNQERKLLLRLFIRAKRRPYI